MPDKPDPLKGLDWPTPKVTVEEQMMVRVGTFTCADHNGRLETEFAITFPHDDSFKIIVELAHGVDILTTESWSRLKAVGANLTTIIIAALEGTTGGRPEAS